MIKRALRLRPYIEILLKQWHKAWTKENTYIHEGHPLKGTIRKNVKRPAALQKGVKLSDDDWEGLIGIHDILAKYEKVARVLEGDGQI